MLNIIEFCESSAFLNKSLWPWQKIILKAFYNLGLNKSERKKVLQDLPIDSDYENYSLVSQFISKLDNELDELVVILGRRGGQTMLGQIIDYYELYRILEMANPLEYFKLEENDIMTILHTSASERSSINDSILQHDGSEILKIPYFANKIESKNIQQIKFNSNLEFAHYHFHAAMMNDNLNIVAAIVEEMFGFGIFIGKDGRDQYPYDFYQKLKTKVQKFGGRVVCLSNAGVKGDDIHKIYCDAFLNPKALVVQLPTYVANPNFRGE